MPCRVSPLAGASSRLASRGRSAGFLNQVIAINDCSVMNIAVDEVPKEIASARVVNATERAGVVVRGLRVANAQHVLRGRDQRGFGAGPGLSG